MNDSNLVGLATTELQLLQSVIARQDEFKEKTKTLAVALFSAISIGFFSGQVTISPLQYIAGSIGVCLTFMILEGAYGVTEIYAENRVKEVEEFLREEPGSNYSGPNISGSLLRAGSFIPLWNSVKRWRTSFLYILLIVLSVLAACFVSPSVPTSEADRKLLLEVAILRDQVRQFEDTLLKRQFETNQKILLEVANLRNQVDKFEKSSMNKNATMSDEIDKRLETINGSFSERIDAVIQKLESKSNPGFDFNELWRDLF